MVGDTNMSELTSRQNNVSDCSTLSRADKSEITYFVIEGFEEKNVEFIQGVHKWDEASNPVELWMLIGINPKECYHD